MGIKWYCLLLVCFLTVLLNYWFLTGIYIWSIKAYGSLPRLKNTSYRLEALAFDSSQCVFKNFFLLMGDRLCKSVWIYCLLKVFLRYTSVELLMLHCGGIVSLLEKCLNAVKSLNSVRVQTRKQVSVLEARALLLAIDNLSDQSVGPQMLFVCLKQICVYWPLLFLKQKHTLILF